MSSYNCPPCPNSAESPQYARMPGKATCPRSDTYRAIESGDNYNVFGWLFRCRTCKGMFFRASREAAREGLRAGELERLAKEAQQRNAR